ncbi:cardiolipin synthase [Pusillimonas sp. TS35]|uniref:phospholipase D-like domain-containing protein n=1 Tax=Paracandidimonas lactea TaxID=2895524 RepID=UPI00136ACD55|nr:phospholipase D-like domain-containing protein [Paracandidimonas lactea]MYN13323.1 cardiolipin synthase [Pusillimonas sp. TS35]
MVISWVTLQYLFNEYWPHAVFLLSLVVGGTAAVHAAMTKNDVRAAIAWVGVIIMSPLLGPLLYLIAGINRVRQEHISDQQNRYLKDWASNPVLPIARTDELDAPQLESLRVAGDRISQFPLRAGNQITLLRGGDETYPAMTAAIDAAQRSIALQTYIFDNDTEGRKIAEALARAHARGVKVRVLIDAVGSRYSRPPIIRLLRRMDVPCALFMTNPWGMRMPYANLRSHRKILVIDGCTAFTGGMNIRNEFATEAAGAEVCMDTHFRIEGPVVLQLMSVFAHDWAFTTREELPLELWSCSVWPTNGQMMAARCIRSGPDRYIVRTHNMLLAAFSAAQHHIRIQSPYFLPDQVLLGAINTAARRGITVDIVIPGRNNLRLVNYAMTAQLDQVIRSGARVWRARGNFDHSKLITIDGAWSYVGSSNLDPRSLRLNFELDMEIYSREMAARIEHIIDQEIAHADEVTLPSLAQIPFRKQLRNRIIWLASPYL